MLAHYNGYGQSAEKYMNLNLRDTQAGMVTRIISDVGDPKNIDGNINSLTSSERWAAQATLRNASEACAEAYQLES